MAVRYRNTDCSSKWLTVYFDNITISADPATTIRHLDKTVDDVIIYPNPSNGRLRISNSKEALGSIKLKNVKGQVVYQSISSLSSRDIEIDLRKDPKGMYFVEIYQDQKATYSKLIYR